MLIVGSGHGALKASQTAGADIRSPYPTSKHISRKNTQNSMGDNVTNTNKKYA